MMARPSTPAARTASSSCGICRSFAQELKALDLNGDDALTPTVGQDSDPAGIRGSDSDLTSYPRTRSGIGILTHRTGVKNVQ